MLPEAEGDLAPIWDQLERNLFKYRRTIKSLNALKAFDKSWGIKSKYLQKARKGSLYSAFAEGAAPSRDADAEYETSERDGTEIGDTFQHADNAFDEAFSFEENPLTLAPNTPKAKARAREQKKLIQEATAEDDDGFEHDYQDGLVDYDDCFWAGEAPLKKRIEKSYTIAHNIRIGLEQNNATNEEKSVVLMHQFMLDRMGRSSKVAKVFNTYFSYEFEYNWVVSRGTKVAIYVGIFVLNVWIWLSIGSLAASKRLEWHIGFLELAMVMILLELLVIQISVYLSSHFYLPLLVYHEIRQAYDDVVQLIKDVALPRRRPVKGKGYNEDDDALDNILVEYEEYDSVIVERVRRIFLHVIDKATRTAEVIRLAAQGEGNASQTEAREPPHTPVSSTKSKRNSAFDPLSQGKIVRLFSDQEGEEVDKFTGTRYFYVSHHLAVRYQHLIEAQIVLAHRDAHVPLKFRYDEAKRTGWRSIKYNLVLRPLLWVATTPIWVQRLVVNSVAPLIFVFVLYILIFLQETFKFLAFMGEYELTAVAGAIVLVLSLVVGPCYHAAIFANANLEHYFDTGEEEEADAEGPIDWCTRVVPFYDHERTNSMGEELFSPTSGAGAGTDLPLVTAAGTSALAAQSISTEDVVATHLEVFGDHHTHLLTSDTLADISEEETMIIDLLPSNPHRRTVMQDFLEVGESSSETRPALVALYSDVLVIKQFDLERCFNKVARDFLYTTEQLSEQETTSALDVNRELNHAVFEVEERLTALDMKLFAQDKNVSDAINIDDMDSNPALWLEKTSLDKRKRQQEELLQVKREYLRVKYRHSFEQELQALSASIDTIHQQFHDTEQNFESSLSAVLATVQGQLMASIQDMSGDNGRRTMNSTGFAADTPTNSVMFDEELEQNTVRLEKLKQAVLTLYSNFVSSRKALLSKHSAQVASASEKLSTFTHRQEELLQLEASETLMLKDLKNLKHVLQKGQDKLDRLKTELRQAKNEKRKLQVWKTDNSLLFVQLNIRIKELESVHADMIKTLQSESEAKELAIGKLKEECIDPAHSLEAAMELDFDQRARELTAILTQRRVRKAQLFEVLGRENTALDLEHQLQDSTAVALSEHAHHLTWTETALYQSDIRQQEETTRTLERENAMLREKLAKLGALQKSPMLPNVNKSPMALLDSSKRRAGYSSFVALRNQVTIIQNARVDKANLTISTGRRHGSSSSSAHRKYFKPATARSNQSQRSSTAVTPSSRGSRTARAAAAAHTSKPAAPPQYGFNKRHKPQAKRPPQKSKRGHRLPSAAVGMSFSLVGHTAAIKPKQKQ
jgi:hypothetical protein